MGFLEKPVALGAHMHTLGSQALALPGSTVPQTLASEASDHRLALLSTCDREAARRSLKRQGNRSRARQVLGPIQVKYASSRRSILSQGGFIGTVRVTAYQCGRCPRSSV